MPQGGHLREGDLELGDTRVSDGAHVFLQTEADVDICVNLHKQRRDKCYRF